MTHSKTLEIHEPRIWAKLQLTVDNQFKKVQPPQPPKKRNWKHLQFLLLHEVSSIS